MPEMIATSATGATNPPRLREALERVRPEMVALDEAKLLQINLDPLAATATVRGALAEIMLIRPQIEQEVPGFDKTNLDKLETYALALIQTHSMHLVAFTPPEALVRLAEEGVRLRELLLSDATALANRGYFKTAVLENLKGPNGYRNLSSDVLALTALHRANWAVTSGKTCVTEAELDRAEVVGEQINMAIGTREQAPSILAAVTLERQQAYTLFINAYDQVRRAVSFLRWNEGDADSIAPSLYAGRTTTRKKNGTDIDATATTAPTIVATTTPVATAVTTPAVTHATTAAVGLPGADPFAS